MPALVRIILYVRDIAAVAAFYERHFAFRRMPSTRRDWLELQPSSGGCTIALHQASKAQKSGAAMKLTFGVLDVPGFVAEKLGEGLKFGPIHSVEGFKFANAKDPAGNSISVSSRGLSSN